MPKAFYEINSEEADWESGSDFEGGNKGHRPRIKGGYFPVPPVDSLHDLRSQMCLAIEEMGVVTEVHHHEVGTAGQCEIGALYNTLVKKADETQILKYCIHNVAHMYGKTATFMPKPIAVSSRTVFSRICQHFWCFKARYQTLVRVGRRVSEGIKRLSMLNNATNIVKCHLTQLTIFITIK
jgi:hypothetical protein